MSNTNQILLSICIPTYNRDKYLKKSIESIVFQKEFLNGMVEVVVSDNASTDETSAVCNEFVKEYSNFHYYRNDSNIRDENFPRVISLANGLYRKLSNDTLIYSDGALEYMCFAIETNKLEKPYIFWGSPSYLNCKEIQQYGFREYVHCVSFYMTSIGTFGLWSEDCSHIEDNHKDCELQLWQVGKSLDVVKEKGAVVIPKDLWETQLVEKKDVSYGLYHVFYENFLSIVSRYIADNSLSELDIEFLKKDLLFRFFINFYMFLTLKQKYLKYSKEENFKECIKNAYKNKPYWKEYVMQYYYKLTILIVKIILKKVLFFIKH